MAEREAQLALSKPLSVEQVGGGDLDADTHARESQDLRARSRTVALRSEAGSISAIASGGTVRVCSPLGRSNKRDSLPLSAADRP
jgi:hypothetical protein